MPSIDTPSAVMYADLKSFGGLANKDAARILLSDKPIYSGLSPRARVDERTFLSRVVVHVSPSSVNDAIFADFSQSAQVITSRIIARLGGTDEARQKVFQHYSGEAMRDLYASLDAYGLDAMVYKNLVRRLAHAALPSRADDVSLLVMAFVATGCLCNPGRAAIEVDRFAKRFLSGAAASTSTTTLTDSAATTTGLIGTADRLGLIRYVDGVARPPIHPLSGEGEGTVVGSLATGKDAINDVGIDVSRQHLRIWRESGTWLCQGLGSTNGTVLVSASDGVERVVEPPRSLRGSQTYPPVMISDGDELRLGRTTRFKVIQIKG